MKVVFDHKVILNWMLHKSTFKLTCWAAMVAMGNVNFGYAITYYGISQESIIYILGYENSPYQDTIDGLINAVLPIGAAFGAFYSCNIWDSQYSQDFPHPRLQKVFHDLRFFRNYYGHNVIVYELPKYIHHSFCVWLHNWYQLFTRSTIHPAIITYRTLRHVWSFLLIGITDWSHHCFYPSMDLPNLSSQYLQPKYGLWALGLQFMESALHIPHLHFCPQIIRISLFLHWRPAQRIFKKRRPRQSWVDHKNHI